MNKKKKRNRIILCICSILVLFVSVFAIIPFNKETNIVYADTTYTNFTFYGSPLYTKVGTYQNDEFTSTIYDVALDYNFSTDSNGYINRIGLSMSFYLGGYISKSFIVSENMGTLEFTNGNFDYEFFYQFSNTRLMGVPIGYQLYSGQNAYAETTTFIKYFDSEGNFLMLSHTFRAGAVNFYTLPIRTYYFDTALNLDTNEYYQQGYNAGKLDGLEQGEDSGYSDGYYAGKNDGYDLGYNTALESDQYSFTNLISAVIDVPVKTFTSLFNFEILGVNLSGFFLGLLTCCIVIGVVRLIL